MHEGAREAGPVAVFLGAKPAHAGKRQRDLVGVMAVPSGPALALADPEAATLPEQDPAPGAHGRPAGFRHAAAKKTGRTGRSPGERCSRLARIFGSESVPSAAKAACARGTISRPSVQSRAPRVRNTGSQAFWLRMVPKPPGEAPIRPIGLPPNTRGMSAAGRDSQSTAFFITPGIELLYSGVTNSSPSAAAMPSFSACTVAGMPSAASRSPSYSGMPRIEAMRSSTPAGISSAAARSKALLNEAWRRLPDRPMRVVMRGAPGRREDAPA